MTKMMKNDEEEEAVRKVSYSTCPCPFFPILSFLLYCCHDDYLTYLVHDYSFRGKSHIDDIFFSPSLK